MSRCRGQAFAPSNNPCLILTRQTGGVICIAFMMPAGCRAAFPYNSGLFYTLHFYRLPGS